LDHQPPIISLRGVSRTYQTGDTSTLRVLDNLDLDIERGTFNVIRGDSGSGKTTLLRILGMLDTGFEGTYLFEDVSVSEQAEWYLDELRANNLGFIFQEGRLFSHMTLRGNIEVPLALHGTRDPADLKRVIESMAPTFFSADERQNKTLDKPPAKVSGGQAQRGSVMRAIVNRPAIILADEPTASLHGELKEEVVRHLLSLTKDGHTVIVVSHDKVFYDHGRQLELVKGVLHEHVGAAVVPAARTIPARMPATAGTILNGWKPRAPLATLFRQALHETFMRPIFLSLILVSLIVGVCQVSVFTSVIVGANDYVDQKITEGSRLNRVQIKPRARDKGEADRFPVRDEIAAMPAVSDVVARRATTTRVVVQEGEPKTYSVSGLHPDDPEYDLLRFVAGGGFDPGSDRAEVILTAGLVNEAFDSTALQAGEVGYDAFIGREVQVIVNRYDMGRKLVAQVPVRMTVVGIILNGEGGRQLYLPNTTLLFFDALVRDRALEYRLPDDPGPDNWPDADLIAQMADFPWEDSLHVYASEIREVLPLYGALSQMGYRPESDIWDFKWALDIQDTAWRVFVPLLVLIVTGVVITVAANILTSAKLRESELALWRVLGMRRGDLVLTQVASIFFSVTTGALAGLALSWVLIDQTRAMLRRRSEEAAAATGDDVQDFDAIFAPVADFFWPVIVAAVLIGIAAALYPAIRTARTDPAKVLQS
jgi:ABC-type lipoprotein export system ATPase subunit/ABC-type lipoprotein release transport system permease subunit